MNEEFEKIIQKRIRELAERREEVLEAFVAKYGHHPDEMYICEQPSTGKWWVEKRPDPMKEKMVEFIKWVASVGVDDDYALPHHARELLKELGEI